MAQSRFIEIRSGETWTSVASLFAEWIRSQSGITMGWSEGDPISLNDGRVLICFRIPDHHGPRIHLFEEWAENTDRLYGISDGRTVTFPRMPRLSFLLTRPPKRTEQAPKSARRIRKKDSRQSIADPVPLTSNVAELARRILNDDHRASMDVVQIREFHDDAEAHDDDLQASIRKQFEGSFETLETELTSVLGAPARRGDDIDELVPLCGVFRFAFWHIKNRVLFAAAAHEDRECPYLLVLGSPGPRGQVQKINDAP